MNGRPKSISKGVQGDVKTLSLGATLPTGTLHVAVKLEVYPDSGDFHRQRQFPAFILQRVNARLRAEQELNTGARRMISKETTDVAAG